MPALPCSVPFRICHKCGACSRASRSGTAPSPSCGANRPTRPMCFVSRHAGRIPDMRGFRRAKRKTRLWCGRSNRRFRTWGRSTFRCSRSCLLSLRPCAGSQVRRVPARGLAAKLRKPGDTRNIVDAHKAYGVLWENRSFPSFSRVLEIRKEFQKACGNFVFFKPLTKIKVRVKRNSA